MNQMTKNPVTIGKIRREIDAVDNQIIRLLLKRFRLSRLMGIIKFKNGSTIIDAGREKQIYQRLLRKSGGSMLEPRLVLGIWKSIIKRSYRIQRQVFDVKKKRSG